MLLKFFHASLHSPFTTDAKSSANGGRYQSNSFTFHLQYLLPLPLPLPLTDALGSLISHNFAAQLYTHIETPNIHHSLEDGTGPGYRRVPRTF